MAETHTTQLNPYIEDGVQRLRTRWPQSHAVRSKYGHHLITVPGVVLPEGYRENICTVLFIAPPGYPAACPDHFFTDIDIRLKDRSIPHNTVPSFGERGNFPDNLWPQWKTAMWWSWHLQMWNPNHGSLYTYMQVIRQRLNLVK